MDADTLSPTNALNLVRILIVEDEYILAVNLQEGLESLGYTVLDIADSAESAIEKAVELQPNLILMDIRLRGDRDGIEAAEQIWNLLQIPIIYITGHSDRSTVERATLTSPFGYILKPIREKELYVAIQTALNRYEREQFLGTVLRGMGDGVIVVDAQCRVKYLNRVAEGLTGWSLEEAKDQDIGSVATFLDEKTRSPIDNPLLEAIAHENTVYLSTGALLVLKNGRTIPASDSAAPLRDNRGRITGAVLVFRDDTQRRLLEERNLANERTLQMEKQLLELQRLNQLKDDFLATTSHELRTPLSNIKLAICMLETVLNGQENIPTQTTTKTETVSRYLSILRDQCEQELSLVNDLLDMRSLEAESYVLELTEISFQEWLPQLLEGFQERAHSHHQTLEISIDEDLPLCTSDVTSLTRIAAELLNNACKYTPAHELIQVMAHFLPAPPAPESCAMNQAQDAGPWVEIVVRNSGVEIPDAQLSKIFDPFYRVPSTNPWKHRGTGLGLALTKRLVEYLQGAITVESEGGWVVFRVQFPLKVPPPSL